MARNPFALPTGTPGRLAGWVMARSDRAHREAADLLAPAAGATVCEVGFGPGQFLAVLAGRDPSLQLCGADPSEVMLAQARARCPAADLRRGTADELPFYDGSADHVAAINNVALWPDRPAGLAEARRVLRPGGTLLLAWHSAAAPSPLNRALSKPAAWWEALLAEVRAEFGNAERHDLRHLTACTATAAST
ncbi:class I SAM-dependent methyltransferase [Dactylosporangium sp. CA-139066]|uniref:class I SAM-dependent methyltransferase n=1 Tax=Dactylosporangium sp. CA-139066 TaxID=3239930 RepID=UPI003D916726